MTREDVLDAATWAVTRAKQHLDYIEFSCEDASRSDWDFMVKVCTEVIRAGATDHQSARHHRPCDSRGIRRNVRVHARARAGRRAGHLERALPQRPGAGGRELAGRDPGRRAADRMHHQWHRRARRQHLDGRSRDGAQDAQGLDGGATAGVETRQIYPASRLLCAGHRMAGAAQQADRRRQRFRARGRHPSGWRAQVQADLRDHEARGHRDSVEQAGAGQAFGTPRVHQSAAGIGRRSRRRSTCKRPSPSSRICATRRRSFTTTISSRW